jgi:hypothetical protein
VQQPPLSARSLGSFYNLIQLSVAFPSARAVGSHIEQQHHGAVLGPRSVGCEGLALTEPGVMTSSVAATLSLYPVNYANGCAQHNFP